MGRKMDGSVDGGERRCIHVFIGKCEGKKCRWEDNIKLDLKKWDGGTWTGLIQLKMGTGSGLL
jgi:hypothetical protein